MVTDSRLRCGPLPRETSLSLPKFAGVKPVSFRQIADQSLFLCETVIVTQAGQNGGPDRMWPQAELGRDHVSIYSSSSCHIHPSLFTEKKQRLREVTAPCQLPDES